MLFTKITSGNYSNPEALPNLIQYVLGEHNRCGLYGATGMLLDSPDTMIHSMLLSPQAVLELGYLFTEHLPGYQTVFGVHDNTGHLHLHIIANSVNYLTGKKNGISFSFINNEYNRRFNQITDDYKRKRLGIVPLCTPQNMFDLLQPDVR